MACHSWPRHFSSRACASPNHIRNRCLRCAGATWWIIRPSSKACATCAGRRRWRSEEHTSELQSQSNLVCRLLLEKKKQPALMPFRELVGMVNASLVRAGSLLIATKEDEPVSNQADSQQYLRRSPNHVAEACHHAN